MFPITLKGTTVHECQQPGQVANHARRTEVIASRSGLLSLRCIWQPVSTSLRPSTRVLGKQTVCCFHYQFHYVPTRSAYVPTRSAVAFETIC